MPTPLPRLRSSSLSAPPAQDTGPQRRVQSHHLRMSALSPTLAAVLGDIRPHGRLLPLVRRRRRQPTEISTSTHIALTERHDRGSASFVCSSAAIHGDPSPTTSLSRVEDVRGNPRETRPHLCLPSARLHRAWRPPTHPTAIINACISERPTHPGCRPSPPWSASVRLEPGRHGGSPSFKREARRQPRQALDHQGRVVL